MTETSEHAAWIKYRRFILFLGTPVVLIWLIPGLVQGVTWWVVVGLVALVVWALNLWLLHRIKPDK